MNPVVFYFVSGDSFYLGDGLLLMLVAVSTWKTAQSHIWLIRVLIWLALALMVMASPPFPWIVDAVFGATFIIWMLVSRKVEQPRGNLWFAPMFALIVLLLVLPTIELMHRRMPVIHGERTNHLVVIGDSISAGIGTRVRPWPEMLQEITGVQIQNLSRPGATMADGVVMAEAVDAQDHLVLVELGGNDLISGQSSNEFGRALERALVKLTAPKRTLVMFELPLLPHMVPYGQIQRRLARTYGVYLIPKRYFTRVISGQEATSDGLHLTDVGARRMALLVRRILSPVLQMTPTTPLATRL